MAEFLRVWCELQRGKLENARKLYNEAVRHFDAELPTPERPSKTGVDCLLRLETMLLRDELGKKIGR